MDWQMIGALGELIGAVAVVVSLVYVGRQLRQSNRIAKAEAYRDFVAGWTSIQLGVAHDPPTAARFMETIQHGQRVVEMPPEEWASYVIRFVATMRTYEAIYRQVEEGVLDDSTLNVVVALFGSATAREAWKLVRESFTDDFRNHLDARFRDAVPAELEGTGQ